MYDAKDNQSGYVEEMWENGSWINYDRLTNTYNEGNSLTKMNYEIWDGSGWYNSYGTALTFTDSRGTSFTYTGFMIDIAYVGQTPVIDEKRNGWTISPNPTSEFIEISNSSQGYEIKIFNLFGECILNFEQTTSTIQRIDISSLPAGMYFIMVGGETKKFMKI